MRFPNLNWALTGRRIPNYRLAHILERSESRISRALRGLTEFTPEERARIAEVLGYPESWLFQGVRLPRQIRDHAKDGVAVAV